MRRACRRAVHPVRRVRWLSAFRALMVSVLLNTVVPAARAFGGLVRARTLGRAEGGPNGPLYGGAVVDQFGYSVVSAVVGALCLPWAFMPERSGSSRWPLWVLLGTVGMVLLIACANIANLFLVRAEEREVEVAVRTAMGASRAVLAREFLLESVVLAAIGGLAGLGLAYGGISFLRYLSPQGLPRIDQVEIDPTVLLFTLAISLTAGFLFGLVPVLRYGRDLVGALKEGGRGWQTRANAILRKAVLGG